VARIGILVAQYDAHVDRGRQPFFLRYFLTLRCVVVVVVTSRARVDDDGAKGAKGAMAMAMHSPASRVKTMWRRERRETRDDDETMASMRIDALRDGSDLEAIDAFYIDPRCDARVAWDRVSCVLVLYNVAILPFDAAFWSDVDGGAVRAARAVGYVTDAFFAVDIVLNFFTAYYDATERLVARRRDIVMHYLRTSFALDVLGSFPFELLVHGSSASLAAVVKFPRLLRMRRVYSFLENKESRSVLLFRIAQLAGGVLLAIHFVACAWFMICDADRGAGADDEGIFAEEDVFWCKRDELTTSSRYVFATHDAVSFLLGNGVGDGMYNAGARGAETVILLFCGILYCVVFGNVASLVNSLMSRNEAFRARMHVVNDAMRYMNVDDDLSNRVRQYYEYLWLRYRDVKVGSMAIARDLPQSLKHELLLHFHSEVLRRVPMFANINEPSTVLAIVNKLKTEIALPGDLLIRRGEPSRGLFFINRGSAEVLLYVSPDVSGKARLASETQANETSPSKRPRRMSRQASLKISEVKISDKNPILRDGDYFGERGILLGDVPLASVLARTFCELHVLTTEDFTSILEFAPEIEEYMIRARLELFSDCEPTDARHSASPSADDVAGNISDENTKEAAIRRRLTLNRAIRRERLGTQAAELVSLNAANDLSDRLDRIESALNDIRRSSRVVRKL